MVAPRNRCDQRRLRLALDDRLPGEAQLELAGHLEQCDDCRSRLEVLAAEGHWWSKARHCLSSDPNDERVASDGLGAGHGDQPWLGFLKPCDDAGALGTLGPYTVTAVVGSGGMGIVVKALEPALNRYVAVKVLAPHLATSGAARRRFAREAQAAAAVVHEHVVAIHAVQEVDGLPYLVMPYIDGRSLQDRLDRNGPLELKEILRIGMQAAAGLAAAHAQGLVHRDVKPANILLENGVERVKLTDFGLARTIDDASLTQSGVLAGTPQYMAPEQARGEAVDHRGDLFSLGSVLYAMCTGHSPFRAETMVAVLRRLCDETPRPIRDVNPDIPDWFAEIVERLHEKQPAGRFQTAEELADLLGRHLAHLQQPALAPKPGRLGRRFKVNHHARRVTLAAALLAAIGLGLAGFWRWKGNGPLSNAEGLSNERQSAPSGIVEGTVPLGLAEWKGFERELEQARRETAEVERQVLQADGPSCRPPDPVTAIDWELQLLERQIDAAAP
ncbi:MAG TPA: protein kinase [Pirellulales bacterium]|nr:protein kinase [Pirellulales bacterium]